ncbi:ankyrin repeat domain-containing protein 45-like isoform X2 [Ptychodera flava]
MTTGDQQPVADDTAEEPKSAEPPRVANIVMDCIQRGDALQLQQCFDDEENPYHAEVGELLNRRDENGKAPIDLACTMGKITVLKLLLEKGADTNIRDIEGKSPLDFACILGRTAVVTELLENETSPDSATARGYTALHRAAAWGQLDCIKCLVEHGADMQMKTTHCERPRETAMRYNRLECAQYLDWAEAKHALVQLIRETKETIEDPQKVLGRLTKDDKMTGINACTEKQEWLDVTEDPTIDDFIQQKKALDEILEPIHVKLSEPPPEKPHRR